MERKLDPFVSHKKGGKLIINTYIYIYINIHQNRITLLKATHFWRTIFSLGHSILWPQDHSDFTTLPFLWLCLVCFGNSRFGEDLGAGDLARPVSASRMYQ